VYAVWRNLAEINGNRLGGGFGPGACSGIVGRLDFGHFLDGVTALFVVGFHALSGQHFSSALTLRKRRRIAAAIDFVFEGLLWLIQNRRIFRGAVF
jgi:hypothetical protein